MAALQATLEASDVPPEARLGDFVQMMRGEMEYVPNLGALYLEFHLYALRNPTARERMNELERADVRAIADILESERTQREIEIDEPVERTARIIVALFRGISMMRASDRRWPGKTCSRAPSCSSPVGSAWRPERLSSVAFGHVGPARLTASVPQVGRVVVAATPGTTLNVRDEAGARPRPTVACWPLSRVSTSTRGRPRRGRR